MNKRKWFLGGDVSKMIEELGAFMEAHKPKTWAEMDASERIAEAVRNGAHVMQSSDVEPGCLAAVKLGTGAVFEASPLYVLLAGDDQTVDAAAKALGLRRWDGSKFLPVEPPTAEEHKP